MKIAFIPTLRFRLRTALWVVPTQGPPELQAVASSHPLPIFSAYQLPCVKDLPFQGHLLSFGALTLAAATLFLLHQAKEAKQDHGSLPRVQSSPDIGPPAQALTGAGPAGTRLYCSLYIKTGLGLAAPLSPGLQFTWPSSQPQAPGAWIASSHGIAGTWGQHSLESWVADRSPSPALLSGHPLGTAIKLCPYSVLVLLTDGTQNTRALLLTPESQLSYRCFLDSVICVLARSPSVSRKPGATCCFPDLCLKGWWLVEGGPQVSGICLLSRQGPQTQLSPGSGGLSEAPQSPVPIPFRAVTILPWQKPTYLPLPIQGTSVCVWGAGHGGAVN